MLSVLITALSIANLCLAQMGSSDGGVGNVTTAFSKAKITPNVIKSFSPIETLDVNFTDPTTMNNIMLVTGSLLTMEQTANQPQFNLGSSNTTDPASTWVIVMFDPDAPTPQMPNVSQFLHFIGGDFSFDASGALTNTSAALVEYFSPTPPPGSDPHRYILLVYDQPSNFDTVAPMIANASTPRTNFSITDFAKSTNLGAPIAGNFFLVGPDSSASNTSSSATGSDTGTAAIPSQTAAQTSGALTSGLPPVTPIPSATAPSMSAPPAPSSGAASQNFNIAALSGVVALLAYWL